MFTVNSNDGGLIMANVIHKINTPEGLRYRIWSTSSDTYRTDVLTENELKRRLLLSELFNALWQHQVNCQELTCIKAIDGWQDENEPVEWPGGEDSPAMKKSRHCQNLAEMAMQAIEDKDPHRTFE